MQVCLTPKPAKLCSDDPENIFAPSQLSTKLCIIWFPGLDAEEELAMYLWRSDLTENVSFV